MNLKFPAVALLSASFATALTLLAVEHTLNRGHPPDDTLRLSALEASTQETRAMLAGIEASLEDVTRQLPSTALSVPGGAGRHADQVAALQERLESMERELASLRRIIPASSPDRAVDIAGTLRTRLKQERLLDNSAYQQGEALFRADYGAPMDEEEERLSRLFQSSGEVVSLTDLRCRSTICRATYQIANLAGLPSSGINAARDAIVNGIAEGYGGAGVHVIHGADQYGNQVMYIQNR